MLAVAIINLALAALLSVLLTSSSGGRSVNKDVLTFMIVGCAIFGVVFLALYFWARTSPFIPSLIGLIIYSLASVSIFVMNTANGQFSVPWLQIVIIALLIQGTSAAKKYETLKRQYGFQ